MYRLIFGLLLSCWAAVAPAQTEQPADALMTWPRLMKIVAAIDPDAQLFGNGAEFTVDDIPILLVVDPSADRMRAMVPIRSADGLDRDELLRLMQANFDSVLDARYAVAQGRLWSVFIHPLSPLRRDQFISGIVQTVNVARTYGTAYSGGAFTYGGGDSTGLYIDLLKELLEKGEEL